MLRPSSHRRPSQGRPLKREVRFHTESHSHVKQHPSLLRVLVRPSHVVMSCTICHCPILVADKFLDPRDSETITQTDHLQPVVAKVCPPRMHQSYYKRFVQMDPKVPGIVCDGVAHAGRGLFFSTQWNVVGGMAFCSKQEDISNKMCTQSVWRCSSQ
jgi:hypothetical protein